MFAHLVLNAVDTHHADDDLHVRNVELLAEVLDEAGEIFAVFGYRLAALKHVVEALEPDQADDLVAGLFVIGREASLEILEHVVEDMYRCPTILAGISHLTSAWTHSR